MSGTDIKYAEHLWALTGDLAPEDLELLGKLPGRWGRMTPMSRLMIYQVGKILQEQKVVKGFKKCVDEGLVIGLIGATRRGSVHTDLAFLESMQQGPGLASPALFGYTLPNIPLAEAATHFGLVGPVYALFDTEQLQRKAVEEAELLLKSQAGLTHMIACEFDHYKDESGSEIIEVNLKLIQRNA